MNGLALREQSDIHLVKDTASNGDEEKAAVAHGVTRALEQLALKLLIEAKALNDAPTLDVRSGIDFYGEVKRFEIDLIKRTLIYTHGSQVRAARLLNLKVTTLNSKIKHYDIDIESLLGGFAPAETGEVLRTSRSAS